MKRYDASFRSMVPYAAYLKWCIVQVALVMLNPIAFGLRQRAKFRAKLRDSERCNYP